jgi:hypothetical protein
MAKIYRCPTQSSRFGVRAGIDGREIKGHDRTARPQCPPGRIEPEHWPLELEPHVGGAATDTPAARLRIDDAQPEPPCPGLFESGVAKFVLEAFALVDDLHHQAILEQLCSERDPPATVTHGVGDKL